MDTIGGHHMLRGERCCVVRGAARWEVLCGERCCVVRGTVWWKVLHGKRCCVYLTLPSLRAVHVIHLWETKAILKSAWRQTHLCWCLSSMFDAQQQERIWRPKECVSSREMDFVLRICMCQSEEQCRVSILSSFSFFEVLKANNFGEIVRGMFKVFCARSLLTSFTRL